MDERQRIARLKQQFEHLPPVRVGIGDDAAVLDLPAGELVWTVDCAVEGTHFTRDLLSMHTLGWRSLMAAASDVAAMGAEPLAVLSALQLPPDLRDQQLEQINDGLQAAARAIGTSVAGGNLSSGPCLSITLSVAGTPLRNAVLRSGARPGDTLRLSGPCGVAALGLRALQRAEQAPLASKLEHAVERWRRPQARFDLAPHLAARASAAIDVSDGLLDDLAALCSASGVGAVLHADKVQELAGIDQLATGLGIDPLVPILTGGEDYELLWSQPPGDGQRDPGHPVGEILPAAEGLRVIDAQGVQVPDLPRGFDHFR